MDAYPLPAGYRWQFSPEIAQNDNAFGALAIVLIYMLLASQFESFLDPLVIMMSVPLALVGITLSLIITQRAFGLTAFIGSLMLVGIAVKNAILVVEFTKQLRRDGMDPRDAIFKRARAACVRS